MKLVNRDIRMRPSHGGALETWRDAREDRSRDRLPLGALGACTLHALSEHAEARGWDLGYVTVETSSIGSSAAPRIARLIEVGEPLDDHQHAELVLVCSDTPVTRAIARAAEISTLILDDARGTAGLLAEDASGSERSGDIARREAAIDQVLNDSFPASDPPSWNSSV